LTAAFLAVPAFAPATKVGLSASAEAASCCIRGTKSNADGRIGSGGSQTTQPGGTKADKTSTFHTSHSDSYRMGGGGGRNK